MAVRDGHGSHGPEDFAGQTVCVGEATTYLDWLNGTLDLGEVTDEYVPADSARVRRRPTRDTDRNCADEWGAGRARLPRAGSHRQATSDRPSKRAYPSVPLMSRSSTSRWPSPSTTRVEDNDSLVAAVDQIVGQMHEDGTLTELSMKWFGEDLTTPAAAE